MPHAMMADAGSESDVEAFVDEAISTHGKLDAIWANAGISGGLVPLGDQTRGAVAEILRINLIGHRMPRRQANGLASDWCGMKPARQAPASQGRRISLVQTTAYSALRHRHAHQRGMAGVA